MFEFIQKFSFPIFALVWFLLMEKRTQVDHFEKMPEIAALLKAILCVNLFALLMIFTFSPSHSFSLTLIVV